MRQQQFEDALRAIFVRLRRETIRMGAVHPDIHRLSLAVLDVRTIAAKALEEAKNDRHTPDHR